MDHWRLFCNVKQKCSSSSSGLQGSAVWLAGEEQVTMMQTEYWASVFPTLSRLLLKEQTNKKQNKTVFLYYCINLYLCFTYDPIYPGTSIRSYKLKGSIPTRLPSCSFRCQSQTPDCHLCIWMTSYETGVPLTATAYSGSIICLNGSQKSGKQITF